jgi:hypothetical protein
MTNLRRLAVVAETDGWIGTPFHHAARLKGIGVDWLMLLAEVYECAGVAAHVEPPLPGESRCSASAAPLLTPRSSPNSSDPRLLDGHPPALVVRRGLRAGPPMLTLFPIGLPTLAVGTWAGFKLFGRLDEAAFRRIVLALFGDFRAEPAGPRPISEGRTGHSRPPAQPWHPAQRGH